MTVSIARFACGALALLALVFAAPERRVMAAGQFDGVYAGSTSYTSDSSPDCRWKIRTLRIRDDRFNQRIDGAPMKGSIGADGSFRATGERQGRRGRWPVTFSGTIKDGVLDGAIHWQICTSRVVLRRR
jgi:hypothetical protein